jgi:HSP20 family protein
MGERPIPGGGREIQRRLIKSLLGEEFLGPVFPELRFQPCVDVYETADCLVIRMEIAGMKKKDIIVEMEGDTLVIRGRREDTAGGPKVRYHQMEIEYGTFERSVRIASPVRRAAVTARYRDGFLEVRLAWRKRMKRGAASAE